MNVLKERKGKRYINLAENNVHGRWRAEVTIEDLKNGGSLEDTFGEIIAGSG